jgi:RimJ/RimL family protein N-acetyltransferase
MGAWWRDLLANRLRVGFAIIADRDTLIGDIEFEQMALYSHEAELRISIGEKSYWNRGLGSQALSEVLDIAQIRLGIRRIYLRVKKDNGRAIRVYEKNGFKKVAKLVANGHLRGRSDLLLMEVVMNQNLALKA